MAFIKLITFCSAAAMISAAPFDTTSRADILVRDSSVCNPANMQIDVVSTLFQKTYEFF